MNDTEIDKALTRHYGGSRRGNGLAKALGVFEARDTIVFVDAAWLAHRQDQHRELAVGCDRCPTLCSRHSAGGVTEEDFAGAAPMDVRLTS